MTADDRLAAALDEIRQRSERSLADPGSLPISHAGVRGLMESAADVPRLLAGYDALLKDHHRSMFPASMGESRGKHYCPACSASVDDQMLYVVWPCGVSLALLHVEDSREEPGDYDPGPEADDQGGMSEHDARWDEVARGEAEHFGEGP